MINIFQIIITPKTFMKIIIIHARATLTNQTIEIVEICLNEND